MPAQELMLNQDANLNFQYNNKMYKVSININNGLVVVKKFIEENAYEYLSITSLDEARMEVQESKEEQVAENKEEI